MTTRPQTRADNLRAAVRLIWIILFVAGTAGWLISFAWIGATRAWLALLVSFLYFTSVSAGLVVWLAIISTSKGKWAAGYEHLAEVGIMLSVPSMAALIALWASSGYWAPWAGKPMVQGFWLDNTFVFSRNLIGLAIFWAMAWYYLLRRKQPAGKTIAPFFIMVYCAEFSLLAFDLIVPLDPLWHSSLFGGYFFITGLYMAIAALALMAAWEPSPDPGFLHDAGKLTLAFSLLTTYMMFSQLLPIWYENLPGETSYVYARLDESPAVSISVGLLAIVYLGPLVMLLTVRAKKNKYILGSICTLILTGMWVERWWLVMPTVEPGRGVGLSEIAVASAFLGLWGLEATFLGRLFPVTQKTDTARS